MTSFEKILEKKKNKYRKQLRKDVAKAIKKGTFNVFYKIGAGFEEIPRLYLDVSKDIDAEVRKAGYYLQCYAYTAEFSCTIKRLEKSKS